MTEKQSPPESAGAVDNPFAGAVVCKVHIMTSQEALRLGVPVAIRKQFRQFRIAKSNDSAFSADSIWYRDIIDTFENGERIERTLKYVFEDTA